MAKNSPDAISRSTCVYGADLAEMARYLLETNGGHGMLRGYPQQMTAIFRRGLCLEKGAVRR